MSYNLLKIILITFSISKGSEGIFGKQIRNIIRSGVLDVNLFRCIIRDGNMCPHQDVNFRMYTPHGYKKGLPLSIKNPFTIYAAGFKKTRESVFLVHGFNGTEADRHVQYLRDAYLSRDYNVITVDWRPLTRYPCYLTGVQNTKLAGQCSAQIYAFLTYHGAVREKITCVGHSLGAHVCGIMSNHLTTKQHRIIGLDPARPMVENLRSKSLRFTDDDATFTQIIHTNAGYLGQGKSEAKLNFCVNGGKYQSFCKGHPVRRSRCSHFLSICYLANAVFKHKSFLGVPCPNGCVALSGPGRLPVYSKNLFSIATQIREYKIGTDASDDMHGTYCIDVSNAKHCPFSDNIT